MLHLEEVERPVPGPGEVLIRVRAASVNALDWHMMRGTPAVARLMFGLRAPRSGRPGRDLAGVVESAGAGASRFRPGDAVFGVARGSLAEWVCTPEGYVVPKPAHVTFEQAAAVPIAGLTALQGLRDHGRLQRGQKVLVNGGAGGVGTFAVQIARALGGEVTAVCSARNLEMVRALGADRVLDYAREDFTRGDQVFDLVYDLVGNHSLAACRRVLRPGGTMVVAGIGGSDAERGGQRIARMLVGMAWAPLSGRRLTGYVAKLLPPDLVTLGELMAQGQVTPVLDQGYTLAETAAAMARLAAGHARGKIVMTIAA